MKSVEFIPLQSMMFRGPGEFAPVVSGLYGRATSFPLPTPSTVAGVLSTRLILLGLSSPPSRDITEWYDEYKEVLKCRLKGPFLKQDGKFYTYDELRKEFLSLEEIKERLVKEWKQKGEPSFEELLRPPKEKEEEKHLVKEPLCKPDPRTGIALEVRGLQKEKKVREGFLYSATYVAYRIDKSDGVSIYVETDGLPFEEEKAVVKLGGEGRIAIMKIMNATPLFKRIDELFRERSETFALYLATPALFDAGILKEGDKTIIEKEVEDRTGLTVIQSTYRTGVLGGGFRLRDGKRKPIYMKLLSGSVFFVEGDIDLKDLWWSCGLGKGWEIGYGTLIPIPL